MVADDLNLGDAVEIVGLDGVVLAKGLASVPASRKAEWLGRRSGELSADLASEAMHRDDLAVLSEESASAAPESPSVSR